MAAASVKEKLIDSNCTSKKIGNTYTASVFFGIASLIDCVGGYLTNMCIIYNYHYHFKEWHLLCLSAPLEVGVICYFNNVLFQRTI